MIALFTTVSGEPGPGQGKAASRPPDGVNRAHEGAGRQSRPAPSGNRWI